MSNFEVIRSVPYDDTLASSTPLPGTAPAASPQAPSLLSLGDDSLTTGAVARAARANGFPALAVDAPARERMQASVRLRDRLIATGQPIYGVTTGFGDSVTTQLGADKAARLQHHLIQYHLNGSGPAATPEVVRATMLIRANCLARGYSGVRVEVVELLMSCLRHDILPIIPERGSVGASGDLVPLCYLADLLTGSGPATLAGVPTTATAALNARGLQPLALQPKEGLALINGTSFMAAFATLATHDAADLVVLADLATALTAEALRGNRSHFHPRVHAHKPHPGQVASAARVHRLLEGSTLAMEHSQVLRANPDLGDRQLLRLDRPIQDRYSLRCAPHVTGVLADTVEWVTRWLDVEVNSTNDNPLFDPGTDDVHSGGNFYGGHVGQAMDSLKTALASVGDLLDRQLALLVDDKYNRGLTANLVAPRSDDDPDAGMHHGFKGAQLACSALAAEALKTANPATVFSRSTEAHNQDKVSMATIAARDARTTVELVQQILAIHLLAACQAADLRGAHHLGDGTTRAYTLIREHTTFADHDRRLDHDLAAITHLIVTGELLRAIAPWLDHSTGNRS